MPKLIPSRLSMLAKGSILAAGLATMAGAAFAQNLFSPVVRVNDYVVTEFEVQQRQRFLQVLNAPGADRESVLEGLIDDRLRNQATARAGIEVTEEGLREGLTEFASRANLTAEEFVTALGQAGVEAETFRDFVRNSLEWRGLVRGRFINRVEVTEKEIDQRIATSQGSGVRVLLSEIIIPAPPQRAAQVNALASDIAQSSSTAEFSGYARKYSATASRGAGGRLPWQALDKLPPSLVPIILALGPGEVTSPLPIPNAVALFQLRAIEETGSPSVTYSEIEYAAYYINGGRSEAALAEAARVRAAVDQCDDLYGVAKGQPPEVLERGAKKPGDIPRDIAIELSKLDPNEVSTALTRANGNTLMFLMLCKRTATQNAEADRGAIADALRQQKLQGHADNLVDQLRADARIIWK